MMRQTQAHTQMQQRASLKAQPALELAYKRKQYIMGHDYMLQEQ